MTDAEPLTPRRLVSAKATGVLEEYDHEIEFKGSGEFAIVYGPNGVGKTRLLEVVDALSALEISKLTNLPFVSATLTFSDGSVFSVEQLAGQERDDEPVEPTTLLFKLDRPSEEPVESRFASAADFATWLSRSSPWHPVEDGVWRNVTTGELSELQELRARYFGRFRTEVRRAGERGPLRELDPRITSFTRNLHVKLIETQRLTALQLERDHRGRYDYGEEPRSVPTITSYSDEVKRLLNANLSANSRLSQSLDSTFPRRMLERGSNSSLTEADLRDKWSEQTSRRARLTEIADLNVDLELSLPDDRLNPWQLSMLELYLEDADKKLDSFADVLKRINLLEEVVNARLLGKRLHIDANNGMVVTRLRDQSNIPLPALSSGEQHEIILMFDLLFNVKEGAVVLIDEPEISLHIGWQKKFIADVIRISGLVGFQFVVATHSPQIIDRWWRFATRLGPKSSDFLGDEDASRDA